MDGTVEGARSGTGGSDKPALLPRAPLVCGTAGTAGITADAKGGLVPSNARVLRVRPAPGCGGFYSGFALLEPTHFKFARSAHGAEICILGRDRGLRVLEASDPAEDPPCIR